MSVKLTGKMLSSTVAYGCLLMMSTVGKRQKYQLFVVKSRSHLNKGCLHLLFYSRLLVVCVFQRFIPTFIYFCWF